MCKSFLLGINPLHDLYELEMAALNLICNFYPQTKQMAVPQSHQVLSLK